jgi:hypothetical protein
MIKRKTTNDALAKTRFRGITRVKMNSDVQHHKAVVPSAGIYGRHGSRRSPADPVVLEQRELRETPRANYPSI